MRVDKRNFLIQKYIRALRLPFITASIFPFILGSFIDRGSFSLNRFLLGLISVIFTHLGANLINDYSDSKTGVDWQDKKFYKFFGGSKLIQEGIFSERFYLRLSVFCFLVASGCIFILAALLKNISILIFYFLILFLGFTYSHKPFQFSYHRLGELIIFILFGPALVMGGYFIQTGIFPDINSFVLSLPFGFLTTAILFANEIPDFSEDSTAGKRTWVSLTGGYRAFGVYYLLVLGALLSILLGIVLGYLGKIAYASFLCIFWAIKSANIIRKYHADKLKLVKSSKLTIAIHNLVSTILIVDILL